VIQRELDLESLQHEDDAVARQRLLALRGVGRWTTEYVLLRGLGRLDVFPGDDVGAQKRLAQWLGHSASLDYAGVRRSVERWQPYAGLVYFHLLLEGLSQTGDLQATAGPRAEHVHRPSPRRASTSDSRAYQRSAKRAACSTASRSRS
jgi:DNA-3-methyladenine glycosylase II